ncbi:MAG: hypothetical protein ACP5N1_04880 [Candidatus Woesearchaeota archaeon]
MEEYYKPIERIFEESFEELTPIIKDLDLSIDKLVLEKLKSKILTNASLQKSLADSNIELEAGINMYASLEDKGNGNKISVIDYLINNPECLDSQKLRTINRIGLNWIEKSREYTSSEKKFCEQARELCNNKFGEIFQYVVLSKDASIKKYVAFSARADGVDEKDITDAIPEIEWNNLRNNSELVILVHNHPDFYRDTKVFENRDGPTEGFITNGALSRQDIRLADEIYFNRLFGKVPVVMMAINEIGLTHLYLGGYSQNNLMSEHFMRC